MIEKTHKTNTHTRGKSANKKWQLRFACVAPISFEMQFRYHLFVIEHFWVIVRFSCYQTWTEKKKKKIYFWFYLLLIFFRIFLFLLYACPFRKWAYCSIFRANLVYFELHLFVCFDFDWDLVTFVFILFDFTWQNS